MSIQPLTFSGHETFHCRPFWLKKGYDHIKADHSLRDDDAIAHLGVGRNMLTSINYWLHAFGLIEDKKLSPLADFLFSAKDGKDPFLENPASLWLLHYHLVVTGYASIYRIVFDELKEDRVEFDEDELLRYLSSKFKATELFSENTLKSDITTFRRTYTRPLKVKHPEDDLNRLLEEIQLVRLREGEQKVNTFLIENEDRPNLPYQLVLYGIIRQLKPGDVAISFQDMLNGNLGVGKIFALSATGLMKKIEAITRNHRGIVYKSDGGVQTLTFNAPPFSKSGPLKLLYELYD